MVDGEKLVYEILNTALGSTYDIYTDAVQAIAKYPCITVEETDNYTPQEYMDGSNNDNYTASVIEINIYTEAKENLGKKEQAKPIFAAVDAVMLSNGFRRMSTVPFSRDTYYRIAVRYIALIGNDETIYRR